MARDQIFISYSHADSEWLKRLQTILAPLQQRGTLDIWTDTRIQPGQLWADEIQKALARAKVAVLLVSPDFLASEFIHRDELPPLLEASRKEGLTIFWVPVRPSLYAETAIAYYQAAHDPGEPLSTLAPAQQETALVVIAKKLTAIQPQSSPALAPAVTPITQKDANIISTEATIKYWYEVNLAWRQLDMEAVKVAIMATNDIDSFNTLAHVMLNSIEHILNISILNVDKELIVTTFNCVDSVRETAILFIKAANLRRLEMSYRQTNRPIPSELRNDIARLMEEQRQLKLHMGEGVDSQMNSLRIKLVQRYGQDFPPWG